jgi:hypothetical protein
VVSIKELKPLPCMSRRSERVTPSPNAWFAGDRNASDLSATHLPRKPRHGAGARIGVSQLDRDANVAGEAGR